MLLRETGARAVHLPVWETLCCGALTLAAAGTDEQQQALLPGVATGELLLTPGAARGRPAITARPRHDVRRRHGHRPQDRRHLRRPGARGSWSPAMHGDQPVVALVDVSDPGVTLLRVRLLERPDHRAHGRPRRRPGRARSATAPRRPLAERYVAGLCLTAAGVVAGARDLTADYIKGRTQFGRSLAEFQAVAMQIADVYIASRTLDLAAENAAWRLDQGLDVERRPRGGGVLDLHRGARRRCAPATTCTAAWAST